MQGENHDKPIVLDQQIHHWTAIDNRIKADLATIQQRIKGQRMKHCINCHLMTREVDSLNAQLTDKINTIWHLRHHNEELQIAYQNRQNRSLSVDKMDRGCSPGFTAKISKKLFADSSPRQCTTQLKTCRMVSTPEEDDQLYISSSETGSEEVQVPNHEAYDRLGSLVEEVSFSNQEYIARNTELQVTLISHQEVITKLQIQLKKSQEQKQQLHQSLQSQASRLKTNLSKVQKERNNLKAQLIRVQSNLGQIQTESRTQKQMLTKQLQKQNQLAEQMQAVKSEKERLQRRLKMTQSLLKDEKTKRQDLRNQNDILEKQSLTLRLTLQNSQERIAQLLEEVESIKKIYEQKVHNHQQQKQKILQQLGQQQLVMIRTQHQISDLKSINDQLATNQKLTHKKEELQNVLENAYEQLQMRKKQASQLSDQVSQKNRMIGQMNKRQKQIEVKMAQALKAQIQQCSNLKTTLSQLSQSLKIQRQTITTLSTRLQEATDVLKQKQSQLQTKQTQLTYIHQQKAQLYSQVSDLKAEKLQLQHSIIQLKEQFLKETDSREPIQEQRMGQICSQRERVQIVLARIKEKLMISEQTINLLKEASQLQAKASQETQKSLYLTIKKLKDEAIQYKEQANEIQQGYQQVVKKLTQTTEQLQAARQSQKAALGSQTKANQLAENVKIRFNESSKQVQQLKRQVEQKQGSLESKALKISQLQQQLSKTQLIIDRLHTSKTTQVNVLGAQVEQLRKQTEQNVKARQYLENELHEVNQKYLKIKIEILDVQMNNQALSKDIASKQLQISTLQASIKDLNGKRSKLQKIESQSTRSERNSTADWRQILELQRQEYQKIIQSLKLSQQEQVKTSNQQLIENQVNMESPQAEIKIIKEQESQSDQNIQQSFKKAIKQATQVLESNKKHLQLEIAQRQSELQHKERQFQNTEKDLKEQLHQLTADLMITKSLLQQEVAEREIQIGIKDRQIYVKQQQYKQREQQLKIDHQRDLRILQQQLIERQTELRVKEAQWQRTQHEQELRETQKDQQFQRIKYMLQQQIDERETQLKAHEKQIYTIEQVNDTKIHEINRVNQQKIDSMQVELVSRDVQIYELTIKIQQYVVQLDEFREMAKDSMSSSGIECSTNTEDIDILKKENEHLTEQLESLTQINQLLEIGKNDHMTSNQALQAENNTFKKKIQDLTILRDHYYKILEGIQTQNDKLTQTNNQLQKSLQETTEKFYQLMTQNQSLEKKCEEFHFHNEVFKQEIIQKEHDLKIMSERQQDMKKELQNSACSIKEIVHLLKLRDDEIHQVVATNQYETLNLISRLQKKVQTINKKLAQVKNILKNKRESEVRQHLQLQVSQQNQEQFTKVKKQRKKVKFVQDKASLQFQSLNKMQEQDRAKCPLQDLENEIETLNKRQSLLIGQRVLSEQHFLDKSDKKLQERVSKQDLQGILADFHPHEQSPIISHKICEQLLKQEVQQEQSLAYKLLRSHKSQRKLQSEKAQKTHFYSSISAGSLSQHSQKEFRDNMKNRKMLAKLKGAHKSDK